MAIKNHLGILGFLLFLGGCRSNQNALQTSIEYQAAVSETENIALIDSILQVGLDKEAVYTLLGKIKPMSSVTLYRMPLANTDSTKQCSPDIVDRKEKGHYLDKLTRIQKAVNEIHLPDLKFVFIPYRSNQDSSRLIQLSVIRISLLDSLLKAKESFFGQYGLVPGADPATVVSAIEHADLYERYRGYGYLFGYPDYAVDFFVETSYKNAGTKKLAPRKFFNIPTYKGEKGFFVYAYPKDQEPSSETDSVLYFRAMNVLDAYKEIRNNYMNADSTLRAYRLLLDAAEHKRPLK